MDYEEFNTVFRISSGLSSEVAKAVVTILSDSVALEGEETFQLNLRLVRPVQLLSYEFIKDTLDVHIIDTTSKCMYNSTHLYVICVSIPFCVQTEKPCIMCACS